MFQIYLQYHSLPALSNPKHLITTRLKHLFDRKNIFKDNL